MQNIRLLLVTILLLSGSILHAQNKEIVLTYISTYREIAIAEMQRSGVPASIKLAQGIHETLAGTSDLVVRSNNHFGIKCKSSWKGESVSHDDDARGECFRKYDSPSDSYKDHSDFLKANQRYAFLFELDPLDYEGWAKGLKKAGYATNPKYPQIIIKLIEDYHLQDYTLIAMGKKNPEELLMANTTIDGEDNTAGPAAITNPEVTAETMVVESATQANWPEGEFKINDTRVVYAKQGTSCLSIAREYNVSLKRLFEFNDMEETETIEKDQLIYLQRKRKTGDNEFHMVKPGETLYDIAQQEGIRMNMLLEYNQLAEDMTPAIGSQLYLKSKAPARPILAKEEVAGNNAIVFAKNDNSTVKNNPVQTSSRGELIRHKVQPRETLYAISKKYNVKIDDIVQWNQLRTHTLKTGQQLKIYKQ